MTISVRLAHLKIISERKLLLFLTECIGEMDDDRFKKVVEEIIEGKLSKMSAELLDNVKSDYSESIHQMALMQHSEDKIGCAARSAFQAALAQALKAKDFELGLNAALAKQHLLFDDIFNE